MGDKLIWNEHSSHMLNLYVGSKTTTKCYYVHCIVKGI